MEKVFIIDFIVRNGKTGCTPSEHYINIPDGIVVDNDFELAQLIYFSDNNELLAYCLDEFNSGYFFSYDELNDDEKQKIENVIFKH